MIVLAPSAGDIAKKLGEPLTLKAICSARDDDIGRCQSGRWAYVDVGGTAIAA